MTNLLNTTAYGNGDGVPLLIVHGLFGSGRNWRALAKRFAHDRAVVTVDMRNHGESFWHDSNTYEDMAGDLAAVISAIGGRADVLGHSMGGKAAMVLALTQPSLVRRLIVADIAPVPYAHSQISNIDVMRNVPLGGLTRRSEAEKFMVKTVAEPSVRAFLLQSLVITESENRWQLNLDALAENMDSIIGFPPMAAQFGGPAHFVSGTASDYVSPGSLPEIRRLFRAPSFYEIEGAGHWLHAEKPREFIRQINSILAFQPGT